MKKMLSLFLLLAQIFYTGYAQDNSMKLEKRNSNYYIVDNNQTYRVDSILLLAKLKPNIILRKGIKGTKASQIGIIRISVPDSVELEKYKSYLQQTGDFEFVEYNCYYTPYLTPNDPLSVDQWYLNTINMNSAWETTTGSSSVKVAVIDNGVSSNHIDLISNLSPYEGYDYVANTCPSTIGNSHGTAVAGVIGASTNNTIGIAGIAGGNNSTGVKIIPYRTDYSINQIIYAIEDAVSKGVKVINMSFGGPYNEALSQAITNAYYSKVTMVCASGNDGHSYLSFPASHSLTIAVGASDASNHRAIFNGNESSNYGNGLDLVAPGVSIKTTDINNNYNYYSGTSLSCPIVSGVVALMLSVNPYLEPNQLKYYIKNTCTTISWYTYDTSGWNEEVGCGLLNANAAVQAAYNLRPYISGPAVPCVVNYYSVSNLPVGYSVEWSLSSSVINLDIDYIPPTITEPDPTNNLCCVCSEGLYARGTLTAKLKKNNNVVSTLTKVIDTGANFSGGTWSQGLTSNTLLSGQSYPIQGGSTVYLQSDDFVGATVSYSSTMLLLGGVSHNNGTISFLPPTIPLPRDMNSQHPQLNNSIVITVTKSGTCEAYQFTFYLEGYTPFNDSDAMLNVNQTGNEYTFTIKQSEDGTSTGRSASDNSPWQLEIVRYDTGQSVYKSQTGNTSINVNTAGWTSGVYVAVATKNGQKMTKKLFIQ